jgi:four helix bundle protein
MTKDELKFRTKQFALAIIKVVDELPNTKSGYAIGNQLVRSGTSVAANYRTACRARSNADFISKITIVEEKAMNRYFGLNSFQSLVFFQKNLMKEADELTAIFTASGKTARNSNPKSQIRNPKYS